MTKSSTILLIAVPLLLVDIPAEAAATALTRKAATETAATFKRKHKGAKPHRGGLFNTGLFRKKNPCGCPGH